MKTSKNWLRPNFLLLPPKNEGLENLGQPPLRPPGPYAPLNETKKDKLFLKQLRSSYLLRVRKKYIPFLK